ncbi:hypothetical protein E4665_08705 [Sporolactobacillus shoreae]|uniref:YCII-related domain-containing protein n=1 Tax=Sporolactobacillus shoreae TaxID=1465501 RepID=A0A4Z0GMM6_9BACL|nr:YciI family protein [Sporolactobacillus shoreae]TGA98315.1 hypothetical protein E4665_08705 [Sporolactobacillus shoreae]
MSGDKKQFIYVLRLIPALLNDSNWTKREEDIVDRHFSRLQKLLNEGKLILAGKTAGIDEKTFGIVILEADSYEEALELMRIDPAVAEGIMTAELYPYHVALMRR